MPSARQLGAHDRRSVADRNALCLLVAASLIFDHAVLQPAIADTIRCGIPISSMSRTSRRAFVAVIEQRFYSHCGQLAVQGVGRFADLRAACVAHRDERDLERCHRLRNMMPFSSWFCSIAAPTTARDADAVTPISKACFFPFSSRNVALIASNTGCEAGRCARPRCAHDLQSALAVGARSPGTTFRISAMKAGSGTSRPKLTP